MDVFPDRGLDDPFFGGLPTFSVDYGSLLHIITIDHYYRRPVKDLGTHSFDERDDHDQTITICKSLFKISD